MAGTRQSRAFQSPCEQPAQTIAAFMKTWILAGGSALGPRGTGWGHPNLSMQRTGLLVRHERGQGRGVRRFLVPDMWRSRTVRYGLSHDREFEFQAIFGGVSPESNAQWVHPVALPVYIMRRIQVSDVSS